MKTDFHKLVKHNHRQEGREGPGRTGLAVRASDSGSGSILGRVGVLLP